MFDEAVEAVHTVENFQTGAIQKTQELWAYGDRGVQILFQLRAVMYEKH